MPELTDADRAARIRTAYGLDGSEAVLVRGLLPSSTAKPDASDIEKAVRRRLNNLAVETGRHNAGREEATALGEAGLPLVPHKEGRWKIDRTAALAQGDQQRADRVRTFYGLDGSVPILLPGYVPLKRAPKDAGDFERSMRRRLNQLTKEVSAGLAEAAALEEAEIPMVKHADNEWHINTALALTENIHKNFVADKERADRVRTFYGLDGSVPVVARGFLPSRTAKPGASELEKTVRQRLHNLIARNLSPGPEEEAALRAAEIPMVLHGEGAWKIDKKNALTEKIHADFLADKARANRVRTFYGLDGSVPVLGLGVLPPSSAPPGSVSELEKAVRQRLRALTEKNSPYNVGPEEEAALREARIPLEPSANGGWYISRKRKSETVGPVGASQEAGPPVVPGEDGGQNFDGLAGQGYSYNPVSVASYDPVQRAGQVTALPQGMEGVPITSAFADASEGSLHPVVPVAAASYLPGPSVYPQARPSSGAGSQPYAGGPSRGPVGPSKRGRR